MLLGDTEQVAGVGVRRVGGASLQMGDDHLIGQHVEGGLPAQVLGLIDGPAVLYQRIEKRVPLGAQAVACRRVQGELGHEQGQFPRDAVAREAVLDPPMHPLAEVLLLPQLFEFELPIHGPEVGHEDRNDRRRLAGVDVVLRVGDARPGQDVLYDPAPKGLLCARLSVIPPP